MSDQEVLRLLKQTRDLLAFHQELGLDELPRSAALEAFLRGAAPEPARKSPAVPGRRKATPSGPAPPAAPHVALTAVREKVAACQRCPCGEGPTRALGSGGTEAGLLVVTDPLPAALAGPADELLTKMLAAIDLARETVYVTLLLKCPLDREPSPGELESCLPLLRLEIAAAAPRVICAMGPLAAATLLRTQKPIFALRGRFRTFQDLPLMPTFHPAFLLKNPEMKKAAWLDLQAIRKRLAQH